MLLVRLAHVLLAVLANCIVLFWSEIYDDDDDNDKERSINSDTVDACRADDVQRSRSIGRCRLVHARCCDYRLIN